MVPDPRLLDPGRQFRLGGAFDRRRRGGRPALRRPVPQDQLCGEGQRDPQPAGASRLGAGGRGGAEARRAALPGKAAQRRRPGRAQGFRRGLPRAEGGLAQAGQEPPGAAGGQGHAPGLSAFLGGDERQPALADPHRGEYRRRAQAFLKRKDSWGFDPRIEAAAQVGHKDFYGPASFDKGHMVRREDPGWGDSDAVARQAEDDTFVYTNAVPQVAQLNQRSWLSLEDYVLQNARSEGFHISVFTGPVFRDDDPLYQGVQVPLEFWKVVAMIDADSGELGVSAYLLGQEGMMPSEGFRYGAFKTYQVPLAKVEASADLRFSSALRKADVLAGTPLEEALESGRFIEIDGPDDLLLSRPGPAGKGR
ncbi:DNA/RNA non-specific endonuclease [Pseudomonas aeruginosa]|uniref:DNA/RNA non-specific endonuclease n=1 Tax=Pseudomonas aeruginosa TaxID=287 RepID=UPI002AC93579|nr:DNA/RNA non-specific endonuclease [Pseudomonas aeruginosa]